MTSMFAKQVVIRAPFSVECGSARVFPFLAPIAERADIALQTWALVRSDSFSEDDWREIQRVKLRNLLVHAGSNVPYWSELFRRIRFDPERFRDTGEMQRIPLVTRAELKATPLASLVAKNISRFRFVQAYTSGSTGEPLRFFQDERDWLRRWVNTFQELRYAGARSGVPVLVIGLAFHHDLDSIGRRFTFEDLEDEPTRRNAIYPFIASHAPVLVTDASIVARMTSLAARDGCKPDELRMHRILYRGEHLSSAAIAAASRMFGCELFTTYGSRECSLLGVECARHSLHAAPWMNYLEIVDDDGRPLPPGVSGHVAVTFFENYAMPFVRYRIGDTGTIRPERCSCGRSSDVLVLEGREATLVRFLGSRTVPLPDLLRFAGGYSADILRYQFEQRDAKTLIFRYVPAGPRLAAVEERIRSFLLEKFRRVTVVVEAVEDIRPQANGKTPVFLKDRGLADDR